MIDETKDGGQQSPEETKPVELSDKDLATVAGGTGPGHVTLGELQISRVVDKSSADLFQKCATGEHYNKGTL